jgi:hypothetical protein
MKEGKSGEAAIDGTHSHTLLEYCLKHKGGIADPHLFVGTLLSDHEGQFAVDKERADRVKVATDYIIAIVAKFPGTQVISEQHVDPASLVGRNDMHGTVDVQLCDKQTVELIDYKDGMNPVEAFQNPQLEQYVVGVMAEILNSGCDFSYETVRLTIIQPKLALKGHNPIVSHNFPADIIISRIIPKLIAEGKATDDPNAPFVPGEKQCNYCPARGNCSAASNHALEKAGIKFADLNVVKEAAEKSATGMTDEQLKEIVEAAPLLRKMIESVEDEAMARLKTGHLIPGIKLVEGRGTRSWREDEETTGTRLTRLGIPKSEVWQRVLISPAQAEKIVWTKRDNTTKQLSERQIKIMNNEFVVKSPGRLTVVPEADRRSGVVFQKVEELFGAVIQQDDSLPDWLS